MDDADRKGFKKYLIVLFFSSIFSIAGIGAMIPFMKVLLQPDKIEHFWLFQHWQYPSIVLFLTLVLIAAFALKNGAALFLLRYQSTFLFGLVEKIQHHLFAGYLAMPYEYHVNRSTPDLIKNINNETVVLANYVIAPLGTFLTEFVASGFLVILLLIFSPVFTLLVTVFLLLGVFCFIRILKRKAEYHAQMRTTAWSAMTRHVLSGFSGIKELKLYHREHFVLKTFVTDARQLKFATVFQFVFQQSPRMLIEFLGLTVVMGILCGFIFMGENPKHLLVLLGIFGVAAVQLLPSLNRLTQAMAQIKYGMPALKTIYNELQQTTTQQMAMLQTKKDLQKMHFSQSIAITNLHYTYQDGTAAVNGVSMVIPKNKRIALVGASGAGKTTVVDLLMGLYSASGGNIVVDNKILMTEADILRLQKLFAYVPQSIILYDQSIKENIAFSISENDIDNEKVWRCLRLAQLDDFVKGLAAQENTVIGEGGIRLSGGQRQRIGIARALYQNPEILVMDEATAALDNPTEKEVTSVLSALENLTIITIAHRLTTIETYDIIYVLDKGKVVSLGTYNELLQQCTVFQRMVRAVEKNEDELLIS